MVYCVCVYVVFMFNRRTISAGGISTEMVYGKQMFTGLKHSNCQWMF